MGIIKRAGDLVYTFRFLRLLTTPFEETEAFKRGIIDKDGKRLKSFTLNTMDNREIYRDYYTPFHRLVFNIKKIMAKAPGGGSRLASYAAALYLLKEKFGVSDKDLKKSLTKVGIDPLDFLEEKTSWFLLDDNQLAPGTYKLLNSKMVNSTLEEVVRAKDLVKVQEDSFPIDNVFGLHIYNATHVKTNQKVFVTVGELAR
tara:strand:- start:3705 stop:4304 length:600 start_codon:yes stop_codon:yes gene_type:complete